MLEIYLRLIKGLIYSFSYVLTIWLLCIYSSMEPLPPNTHRKGYLERVTTWGLESEICGFRWGHCPGRTSVSGYCRRKVDLGGPIRVATPRRVDWQAGRHGLPVKALSVGAGRSYCDGGVICRLLRHAKGVHLHGAICRVSRGCCMSLLPQGESNVGIVAKQACSQ